jgi:hypothetical protein
MPSIEVSDKIFQRLESFKKVIDEMFHKKLTFEQYVALVLDNGLDTMLRAVLPAKLEVMHLVLEKLFEENPELISDFLAESIRRGEELIEMLRKERESLRAKYKQRLRYLG